MRASALLALLAAVGLLSAGCAGDQPPVSHGTGVSGLVHLGPTCPVEQEGQDCADKPAADVAVTVSKPDQSGAGLGMRVATATTDSDGRFRVDAPPGHYVVTADAGMSCQIVDVTVTADSYAEVDVPCDTGIR